MNALVISTDSVYDGRCKRTPEDENGICIKAEGNTKDCDYAVNKRHMELVLLKEMEAESPRLKITIFRPGHIYSPGFLLGCFPEHSRQGDTSRGLRPINPQAKSHCREQAPAMAFTLRICTAHCHRGNRPRSGSSATSNLKIKKT